jgi:hypothetical protein
MKFTLPQVTCQWKLLETNWEENRIVRGGSTITQQLDKNLYPLTLKARYENLRNGSSGCSKPD